MKFSIVTISFNQGQYLEETINSVLNQRGVEVEYIVVDPGSKDNSRDIIQKYKDSITHIIFEKDTGPGNGLNKGFSYATGDVLGYLNSDDILMPGSLKKVSDIFLKNLNIDVVSSHGYIIDEYSRVRHKVFSNKLNNSFCTLRHFSSGNYIIVQQATFFKKQLFRKVGGFDETGNVVWDAALVIDFMKSNATFKVVDDFWAGFRIYPDSLSGSGYFKNTKIYEQLSSYAGVKYFRGFEKIYFPMYKWLREPNIFFKRLIDGFQNPIRLI